MASVESTPGSTAGATSTLTLIQLITQKIVDRTATSELDQIFDKLSSSTPGSVYGRTDTYSIIDHLLVVQKNLNMQVTSGESAPGFTVGAKSTF